MSERQGRRALIATIQPLCGVLRVHPDGGRYQEGAPYDWAASVAFEPGGTARIYGAMAAPKPSQWRAIRAALERFGVRRMAWERHTPRGYREVIVRIKADG